MEKVIFDTNSYRYLVQNTSFEAIDKLIIELKEKEARHNIEPLFSPIVAQELLAHLADKNDPYFSKCLKANKALYLHNGSSLSCNVFPGFEVLLAKRYFNQVPEKRVETLNAILQISYHFATNPSDETFTKLDHNLQQLKQTVEIGENGFVQEMFEMVRKFEPNEATWQIFKRDKKKRQQLLKEIRSYETSFAIAAGYLATTEIILRLSGHNSTLNADQIMHYSKDIVQSFPEPIDLFKNVLENLVNSEFVMTEKSRANFIWDIALMFACGNHSIDGSKLYFITSDKAIIKTAVNKGSGCYVLTLDEYLQYLS